jgi:hypothetical protein
LDLVFVACNLEDAVNMAVKLYERMESYLETFSALLQSHDGDISQSGILLLMSGLAGLEEIGGVLYLI